MKTELMLMARYDAKPIIPIEDVITDFFGHLSRPNFLRKILDGTIKLPVVILEPGSQKSAKGIHLTDLACYLDSRHAEAVSEYARLHG